MSPTGTLDTKSAWRLDLPNSGQTLVFGTTNGFLPEILYCGTSLPGNENLESIRRCAVRPISPGTMDQLAPLSILPEEGRGFPGKPGIEAFDADGRLILTQFTVTDVDEQKECLTFHCSDKNSGLRLSLTFDGSNQSGILKTSTTLTNNSTSNLCVHWLSTPAVTVSESCSELIEFTGRWTQEFTPVRQPLTHGIRMHENKRGRTGFDHFPAMIFASSQTSFEQGSAQAVHFTQSDLNRMFVETLPDGRRQMQCGFPEPRWLAPGDTISSGFALWAFSSIGLNGLSHCYQHYARHHLITYPKPDSARPIHYNSWEAVYFDHDIDVLKDLATRASHIGAERFVLDDGWFGTEDFSRDDDTTSLGDWFVDAKKYPEGLNPLIEHVHAAGMSFGIWMEPEMVNLDSTLARTHPEWIMKHGEATHPEGRQQHVLDLTNEDVCNYLFERIDWLFSNHAVDYVKWDMNRNIARPVDADGFPLLLRQSNAVRELFARVRAAHPNVEIESCASGGGRIDFGMLEHVQRFWLSDSQDAHVRWKMQNNAFLFLPPETYGSHVGAAHCHTSGRRLSMSFRALVATTASMGIEADLRELSNDDLSTLKRYTDHYKQHRTWMHQSTQYRLDTNNEEELANLFVANDKSQFLLYAGVIDVPRHETSSPVCLTGLETDALYRVRLLNPEDIDPLATRIFDSPLFDTDGIKLSGAQLTHAGVVLPFAMPDSMFVVQGEKV